MNKPRNIVMRARGQQHGIIRRMVSPNDLGEVLKPFVFLDHIHGMVPPGMGFGWHPHSGIATLTYQRNADTAYEDTTGQQGIVQATGLEWMRAGGGTWHQGQVHPREPMVVGFQLWLALPPGVEDGPSQGIYVPPDQVPQVGPVRVLLGTYEGVTNPIPAPSPVTYLDVALAAGERWHFTPPPEHTVGWAFVYEGRAQLGNDPVAGELVVLDASNATVTLEAQETSRILFGSAPKHDHPLVLGTHSVHTNERSLHRGIQTIRAVGEQLRRAGRL